MSYVGCVLGTHAVCHGLLVNPWLTLCFTPL